MNIKTVDLCIGKDFFDDPWGRFYTDGDGSGEEFREEVLKPLLEKELKLKLNISDDVEGYGSSFLVEAFGGLVKYGYFNKEDLFNRIEIVYTVSDFEFYKNKIINYISAAKYNSSEYVSSKDEALQLGVFKNKISKEFVFRLIEG